MKIAILEKANFSKVQMAKLESLGQVDCYDNLTQEDANRLAPKYDVVVINWLDPTPFIMNMKSGSLVALLSTGYGWITNIKDAHDKGVYVANVPNYSTEAVSQHLLGMLLGISKNIFPTLNGDNNNTVGFEFKDKTIGIIGLGNIGSRFAEIMNFFGAKIITYNRNHKNSPIAEDVSLDDLLRLSDVICISCAVNSNSENMINMSNVNRIKKGAVIIGSTWNILDDSAILYALKEGIVRSISFDAAIEAGSHVMDELQNYPERVFLTPHIAFNTTESEIRQLDICINNILSFVNGNPKNIVVE